MHILHYALGLPPYRSGGLTRYAMDLMRAQALTSENKVTLLYPGETSFLRSASIQKRKSFSKVAVYEIINPPFVPLMNGIRNPLWILNPMHTLQKDAIEKFLKEIQPEILHIHTLMGIPERLLEIAKQQGIRTIYTTHDYFGICPRVVLTDALGSPCDGPSPSKCDSCNANAQGWWKGYLHSQKLLHRAKKGLRHLFITRPASLSPQEMPAARFPERYQTLQRWYADQFQSIDSFHFVSSISESLFRKWIPGINGVRIPITHAGIKDHRPNTQSKKQHRGAVRFGFIGDSTPFKGYPFLKDVLAQLSRDGITNWELHVYGPGHEHEAHMERVFIHGSYQYNDLEKIYSGMDVLVVPSQWPETFSLVALEAMSFGVPALVLECVGAKDIIGIVSKEMICSNKTLQKRIINIIKDQTIIDNYRVAIKNAELPLQQNRHVEIITSFYSAML